MTGHKGTEGEDSIETYPKETKMARISINPEDLVQFIPFVEAYLPEDEYTAYGVSVALNKILEKAGLQPVRSQMMYNYLRNGLVVPGEKIYGPTLRKVTKAEAAMFLIRYALRNNITLGEPVSPDQLALDLEV